MARTTVVLVRSRLRLWNRADRRTLVNSHRSTARRRLTQSASSSRASWAKRRPWTAGSWASSAPLIRSMRVRARAGSVSQVSKAVSHSFGPRAPKVSMKELNDVQSSAVGLCGWSLAARSRRSARPSTPWSKVALRSGSSLILRLSCQMACDGAAESTSPSPARSLATRRGSFSRFSQMLVSTAIVVPAAKLTIRWRSNNSANMVLKASMGLRNSPSVAWAGSGREARKRSTMT